MNILVRTSLDRPRLVIAAWVAVIAAASPFAARLSGSLRGSTDSVSGSPSELVARDVDAAFGAGSAFVFPVVVSSPVVPVSDPRFAAAADSLSRAFARAGMHRTDHYWNSGNGAWLGRDGRSALLLVTPDATTFFGAEGDVRRIRDAASAAGLDQAFQVKVTGMVSLFHDLDASASDDLMRAERVGIPLTLAVLALVFGAPVAAGLPILLALGTIVIALAALFLMSHAMPVSVFAQNVVTMVGLGIGVDYALFLVSRCRAELARGAPFREAVEVAAARVSHAVLVSGAAVAIGFGALRVARVSFLHTLALGGLVVVAAAVLITLTLLPAVLIVVGPKLNWPRHPSRTARARRSAWWTRWSRRVMSRPWLYLVPALVVLAVFIVPSGRLRPWNMGAKDLPATMEARQGFDELEGQFAAGWMGPVALLVQVRDRGTVWSASRERAIAGLRDTLVADPRVAGIVGFPMLLDGLGAARSAIHETSDLPAQLHSAARPVVTEDGRTALVVVVPRGAPESPDAMSLVRDLRARAWRGARGAGLDVRVGGFGASIIDFDDEMFRSLRIVVPAVLAVTFVILLVSFRSVVVPLKAITMNLVSVLSAYGFLVYVFQDGIGASAIGLVPPGGLNSFIVLMLFTILFGLSMDYEVFLLGRIQEAWRRTADNAQAVAEGLAQTGGLITSAAAIMVMLFGSFGFTRLTATREFGLGLAFAVALDATIIRVVLVPTLMGLLGRANWWFPRWSPRYGAPDVPGRRTYMRS